MNSSSWRRCAQASSYHASAGQRLPSVAKNILYFGGDRVSVASLTAIHDRLTRIGGALEVVHPMAAKTSGKAGSSGDAATSSLNAVQAFCKERGITAHCVDHPKSIVKSSFRPPWNDPKSQFDAVVIASCRYFLPDALLQALPPAINMHPSLLPKYRGASPIFETLRRGDDAGGISIIKLEPKLMMDSGDILLQRRLPIDPLSDCRTYFPAAAEEGGKALVEVLDAFADHWAAATPQADNTLHFTSDPFHAPLLDKTAGRLRWDSMTGDEARHTWRAFVGYLPVGSSFCRSATPSGAKIKDAAKKAPFSVTFNEVLHPTLVSDKVHAELAIVDSQAQPGAAYFPYTRNTDGSVVGAVKCKDGWLLYSSVTLRGGAPQAPFTVAASAECKLGFVYNGVFAADANRAAAAASR